MTDLLWFLVKVRLQATPLSERKNVLETIVHILRNEGVSGLYRGVSCFKHQIPGIADSKNSCQQAYFVNVSLLLIISIPYADTRAQ